MIKSSLIQTESNFFLGIDRWIQARYSLEIRANLRLWEMVQ